MRCMSTAPRAGEGLLQLTRLRAGCSSPWAGARLLQLARQRAGCCAPPPAAALLRWASSGSGVATPRAPPPAPPPANESVLQLARRIIAKGPKRGDAAAAAVPGDGTAPAAAAAAPPERIDGVTLRRLVALLRPEAVPVGVSVATLAVTTGISLLFPYAIGQILDLALAPSAAWSPGSISVGLLGLFGLQSGLIVLRSALLTVSGERMAASLRKDAFRAMLSQELAWFDRHRTGELLNRLTADTALVQKALTSNVASGLRSAAMTVGCTGMLFALSPSLALLSLALIPPVALGGMYYGKYLQGQQRAVQEALGEASSAAEEILGQIRTVRGFAGERAEAARFGARVNDAYGQARKIGLVAAYFDGAVHMAANVSLVAVLWYGGELVASHALSAGDLTAFLLYSVYTGFNVSSLSTTYSELKRAAGASGRLFELTDRTPAMPLAAGSGADFWGAQIARDAAAVEGGVATPWYMRRAPERGLAGDGSGGGVLLERGYLSAGARGASGGAPLTTLPSVAGRLDFTDVHFAYPARPDAPIMRGLSLAVPAGQTLAIVGASGSGKSTVAALAQRLYDPDAGVVRLDGVPLTELDPSWLRGAVIGSVAQEPQLFACSVADNIRYGRPDATDDEVVAAARLANAHSFIARFPEGYATFVGERGLKLSGGEKQRVAIARAILKSPPVLILDEATSALDAESEAAVMAALDAVSAGRTVITIAHRLSTMQRADSVAVVAGGRVVEVGTFAALFADPTSAFRQLIERQLGVGGGAGAAAPVAAAALPAAPAA